MTDTSLDAFRRRLKGQHSAGHKKQTDVLGKSVSFFV